MTPSLSISSPVILTDSFNFSSSASDSQSLRPTSYIRPNSAHLLLSPTSDIVGPSPVTSNGTETTEIEDDEAEEHAGQGQGQHGHQSVSPASWRDIEPNLRC